MKTTGKNILLTKSAVIQSPKHRLQSEKRQSDSVTNTNVSNSYENKDRNNVCVCGAEVETNSHKQKNQGSNLHSSKQKTSIPNNIDSINVHDSINCP